MPVDLLFPFKIESPYDIIIGYTGLDTLIVCNIDIVVKVDKIIIPYLPVHGQYGKCEKQANQHIQANIEKGVCLPAFLALVLS